MKDVTIITGFPFCLVTHRGTVAAYLLTEQLVCLPGKPWGQGPVWDAQGKADSSKLSCVLKEAHQDCLLGLEHLKARVCGCEKENSWRTIVTWKPFIRAFELTAKYTKAHCKRNITPNSTQVKFFKKKTYKGLSPLLSRVNSTHEGNPCPRFQSQFCLVC